MSTCHKVPYAYVITHLGILIFVFCFTPNDFQTYCDGESCCYPSDVTESQDPACSDIVDTTIREHCDYAVRCKHTH